MSDKIIPFRLRNVRDKDLEAAFGALPDHIERADLIREALRNYFFDAPTPFRDTYLKYINEVEFNPPPQLEKREVVRKVPLPKPQTLPVITHTAETVSNDIDDKLNQSLGF